MKSAYTPNVSVKIAKPSQQAKTKTQKIFKMKVSNSILLQRQFAKRKKPAAQFPNHVLTLPRNTENENVYVKTEQHQNSQLVMPFLNIFKWTLLMPCGIEYNHDQKGYICKNANNWMQGFSYVWLTLMTAYLSLIFFNDMDRPATVNVMLGKVTWGLYTLFDASAITQLRINGHAIAKILTEGHRISCLCDRINSMTGETVAEKKTMLTHIVVWLASILGIIYTIGFVLFVILELTIETTNLYNIFMDLTNERNITELEFKCWTGQSSCKLFYQSGQSICAFILLAFWILMAFFVEIIWVTFLLMAIFWTIYFKRLLTSCSNIIEAEYVNLNEGIHIYTRITVLMEDFNDIFGSTLLWIIFASVMYTTLTLGEYLAGNIHGVLYNWLNVGGFVLFIAALLAGSELHKMSRKIPYVIKKRFMTLGAVRDYNQALQILYGATLVQYDAIINHIGLKGLGFFTVSYAFIIRLVGVTITYSFIALQLKLGEVPLMS